MVETESLNKVQFKINNPRLQILTFKRRKQVKKMRESRVCSVVSVAVSP
jgi:hypothetical protein